MIQPSFLATSGTELFTAPPGHCPKCIAPRREAAGFCPSCGLAFRHFHLEDHLPPEYVADAWRALLGNWADAKTHRAFLLMAQAREQLVPAARLYRIQRARHPDDAMAQQGLDEIVRMALVPTDVASRTEAPPSRQHSPLRGAWAILLMGAGVLLLAPIVRGFLH